MRTIKFRGLRIDNKEWVYGNLIDSGLTNKKQYFILTEDANNYDEFDEVIPETIGQFTGLSDKNGLDIYEGDILKGKTDDYIYGFLSPVEFYAGSFHVTIAYDLHAIPLSGYDTVWLQNGCKGNEETSLWIAEFEIISNIHQK